MNYVCQENSFVFDSLPHKPFCVPLKVKKLNSHIEGTPPFWGLSCRMLLPQLRKQPGQLGQEERVAASEKSQRAVATCTSATLEGQTALCSPERIFLTSRLTILVHNWIILLFFSNHSVCPRPCQMYWFRWVLHRKELSLLKRTNRKIKKKKIHLAKDSKSSPASSVNW